MRRLSFLFLTFLLITNFTIDAGRSFPEREDDGCENAVGCAAILGGGLCLTGGATAAVAGVLHKLSVYRFAEVLCTTATGFTGAGYCFCCPLLTNLTLCPENTKTNDH